MTKQEAEWLAGSMKKEGWPEVRIEPSVGEGYVVAFRRLPDEAYRYARHLSAAVQARRGSASSDAYPRKRGALT